MSVYEPAGVGVPPRPCDASHESTWALGSLLIMKCHVYATSVSSLEWEPVPRGLEFYDMG